MALTAGARGGLGAWVVDHRKPPYRDKAWTQEELAKALRAVTRAAQWNRTKVADIERGKHELTADERADLVAVLGEMPDFEDVAPPDLGGLVIAYALAKKINDRL